MKHQECQAGSMFVMHWINGMQGLYWGYPMQLDLI